MAEIFKGAPAAAALNERTAQRVCILREKGIVPTLAIVRVGARSDDIYYERNACRCCEKLGIAVKCAALPQDVPQEDFFALLHELGAAEDIHGILMFQPLPKQIDAERARNMLPPQKDVDGCTDASLGGVFTGSGIGFAPCTAQSVMEILAHYKVKCEGKRAVVLGRSLVVGRPAAMLLLHENATVTLCHSRTEKLAETVREADIVVSCIGKARAATAPLFRAGQVVIDVGINTDEEGKLCGDVDFAAVEPIVDALTSVPGGVGAVTVSVLAAHTVQAAERANGIG